LGDGGLRKPSRREAYALDVEPLGNLGGAARELERPDRIGRVDVQRPVSGDTRRPGTPRDRLADSARPGLDERGDSRLGPEASELAVDLVTEPLHRTTVPASPASTSTSWSASAGNAAELVLVISAWP